jgi:pilus assembly protein Flp/PilA
MAGLFSIGTIAFSGTYEFIVIPKRLTSTSGECKMTVLAKFLKDESGATAIEYGLIAAGISIAIIATVNGIGTKLATTFTSIETQLK